MAKTRLGYISATCCLSCAAAIISFISLGTQEWVISTVRGYYAADGSSSGDDHIRFGLFGGVFKQLSALRATFELTMVCLFDKNICALLCGDNMATNLKKLYYKQEIPIEDVDKCAAITSDRVALSLYNQIFVGNVDFDEKDRVFINAGIWLSTIIFLNLSAVMGLISAVLAAWNVSHNPSTACFNVFGLYLYNTIAFCCILLTITLWGVMFSKDLRNHEIPTYKTFLEEFSSEKRTNLGYSYWINFVSLLFYLVNIFLLYIRSYIVSKDGTKAEENTNPLLLR